MSVVNPTEAPYPLGIKGLDTKVEAINAKLNEIPWLTRAHNRAWNLPETREEGLYRQPRIYSGDREYWNVMPNDNLDAFSFMIGIGPALPVGDDIQPFAKPIRWTKRLDLIFFLDLSKIYPDRTYVYTEELNEEILTTLSTVPGVLVNQIWMEDIRDVYEGFDLSEIELEHLYYPFAGIRYELEVSYSITDLLCTGTGNGVTFDPDAEAWLNRMTSPTTTEQEGINNYVIAEKAANIWGLRDEDYVLCLGAVNSIVGAISKTAIINGGVTFDVNGATFNGTNGYINTNWIASVDGVNYVLNDSNISFFLKQVNPTASLKVAMGALAGRTDFGIRSTTSESRINNTQLNVVGAVSNNEMWAMVDDATNIRLFKDGGVNTTGVGGTTVSTEEIYLGARNNSGIAASFADITMSTFCVSAAIGWDHTAHNTNVRNLLTTLGVVLP